MQKSRWHRGWRVYKHGSAWIGENPGCGAAAHLPTLAKLKSYIDSLSKRRANPMARRKKRAKRTRRTTGSAAARKITQKIRKLKAERRALHKKTRTRRRR